MNIAFIIAVSVFLSILTYIAFKLDKTHLVLKFFLLFMVLYGFPVMVKGFTQDCELVPTTVYETYQYGNNFTGYHWDYDTGSAPDGPQVDAYVFHKNISTNYSYICTNVSQEGEISSFIKITMWLSRIFSTYLLIYLTYSVFVAFKNKRFRVK
jgi:hypothetical protein